MNDILLKLLEPENLNTIVGVIIGFLYITGRITRGQFIAEQMKFKGIIDGSEAKNVAVNDATKPITVIFDVLNAIPIVNTKIPIINVSVPELAKGLIQAPFGLVNDILHNIPFLGTNINNKK